VIGGQFDWGGSLLKSNKGAQRLAQAGRQSAVECKRISQLDCKSDRTRRYESRANDPVVKSGIAIAQRIIGTLG